ncbi:uncharacterized protein METZ01_LOCUS295438, partial [marine metagenome]
KSFKIGVENYSVGLSSFPRASELAFTKYLPSVQRRSFMWKPEIKGSVRLAS